MAKAHGKKSTHNPLRGTNDAQRLAAIHWLAMKIEQVSIEVLVTDRNKFGAVEAALRVQVKLLQEMGRLGALAGDDCPEGYVLCRDGLCAPMCDGANTVAAASSKKGKKR